MNDSITAKTAWVTPELTTYGKVEEITQDTYKVIGPGDGVIICIGDTTSPVSTVSSCPGSC